MPCARPWGDSSSRCRSGNGCLTAHGDSAQASRACGIVSVCERASYGEPSRTEIGDAVAVAVAEPSDQPWKEWDVQRHVHPWSGKDTGVRRMRS